MFNFDSFAIPFECFFSNFALVYFFDRNGKDFESLLFQAARRVSISVLKKTLDPQRNKPVEKYVIPSDKKGGVCDNGYKKVLSDMLISLYANDSVEKMSFDAQDILTESVAAIMKESESFINRFGYLDFFTPFETVSLRKKVLIKKGTAEENTRETTVIQEIYKSVRRYIQGYHIQDVNNFAYVSLYDLIQFENGTLDDSDLPENISIENMVECYYRLPKYSCFVTSPSDIEKSKFDISGSCETVETGNITDALEYYNMREKLQLTDRQNTILDYRIAGYGNQKIADKLKVSKSTIETHMDRMQEKAIEAFNLPESMRETSAKCNGKAKLTEQQKSDIVNMFNTGKYTQATIATMYGVSKMTISRIIEKAC